MVEIYGRGANSNIEAGVKYLRYLKGYMLSHYGFLEEGYLRRLVVQAYHDGPSRARREKGNPRDITLRYIRGVKMFFNILSKRSDELASLAKKVSIFIIKNPMTWAEIAKELGVLEEEVRSYNPVLESFFPVIVCKNKAIVFPVAMTNKATSN
ncbi:MAG: hypothetical protein K9M15_02650 [Candidatus Marinimicrobia bacterium]|nr:hypothetical protein [Candidatus Neomarinimicrobiota bacterium]